MERRLVTTDCHIAPPFSLVDELPESYREYFPRIDRRHDGAYLMQPRSEKMAALMMDRGDDGFEIPDDRVSLARAAVGNVCPEAAPSFDPAEQLAELERDGVYGAVLIARITVFDMGTPPDVEAAYLPGGQRLAGGDVGAVPRSGRTRNPPPVQGRRCLGEGARARRGHGPAAGVAAGWHLRAPVPPGGVGAAVGGRERLEGAVHHARRRHRAAPNPNPQAAVFPGIADVSWYTLCCGMGETLGWLTYNGMFEKYPDLHLVMTEGYAGWLGFAMQFFDHHWSDSRLHSLGIGASPASPKIDAPPSVYLKRQAHATFMWDPIAIRNRDITGLDCLLWGNDYPHNEGSFPFSQEWVDKQFAGVPDDEIDTIVRGNAASIFSIVV